MPVEIERKYLVVGDGWRNTVERKIDMVQGYLTLDPERTVRVRLNYPSKAYLTIKGPTEDATRSEFEYEIPRSEANELLDMCVPPLIEKTRYMVDSGEQTWEVDVFDGANEGLRLAEVELDDESETFEMPDWLGDEVTGDSRLYNAALVQNPYRF